MPRERLRRGTTYIVQRAGRCGTSSRVRGLTRGRWDWLRELVRRQRPGAPTGYAGRRDALRDALACLGLAPDALIDGVAAALGIAPIELCTPTSATLGRVEGDDLAVLLPLLCEHPFEELRTIGQRWVDEPAVVYHVPADAGEDWLERLPTLADRLAPRVVDEGLAWLGPDALRRLAVAGCTPAVREAAAQWIQAMVGGGAR